MLYLKPILAFERRLRLRSLLRKYMCTSGETNPLSKKPNEIAVRRRIEI